MALFLVVIVGVALIMAVIALRKAKSRPLESILEGIYKILVDDNAQTMLYPEPLKENLKENTPNRAVSGLYGLSPGDPIRANGPIGELVYISRLISASGCGFVGHRLGSIKGLDVFEVVSTDFDEWFVLCFDMYWLSKDDIAPAGLRLAGGIDLWPDGGAPGLSATNRFLSAFPVGIWEGLLSSTEKMLGFAAVKPYVKSLDTSVAIRPDEHSRLLQEVIVVMRAEGVGEDE